MFVLFLYEHIFSSPYTRVFVRVYEGSLIPVAVIVLHAHLVSPAFSIASISGGIKMGRESAA
jgi:hypothetical protein